MQRGADAEVQEVAAASAARAAWDLHEDGTWARHQIDGEPRSVQRELMSGHAARGRGRSYFLNFSVSASLRSAVCPIAASLWCLLSSLTPLGSRTVRLLVWPAATA